MIACNSSNHWQEALQVYAQLLQAGHAPNTTTYNALISAWSKAGRLEQVGVLMGCATHAMPCCASVLHISQVQRLTVPAAAQVMEAYQQMIASGCERTVITYSSLISACEKEGKWEMAMQVYQQMLNDG